MHPNYTESNTRKQTHGNTPSRKNNRNLRLLVLFLTRRLVVLVAVIGVIDPATLTDDAILPNPGFDEQKGKYHSALLSSSVTL